MAVSYFHPIARIKVLAYWIYIIEFINCRNALLVSHIMIWTNF